MNSNLNMDHTKPNWKVSWISRWNLLLVAFCLLDLSNGIQFNTKPKGKFHHWSGTLDLVCSDINYPKTVTISKIGGQILLNKTNPTKQLKFEATHRINNINCEEIGLYECEVLHYDGTKTSTTLDIVVYGCIDLRISPRGGKIKLGDDGSITCIGSGYPESLTISRRGDQDIFTASNTKKKFLFEVSHLINNIQCDHMGFYECRGIIRWRNHTATSHLVVGIKNCPPQLCPGEKKLKAISATVGETKTVSICVIAYPGLDSVRLNGTRIYRNQTDSKFDVDYSTTDSNRLFFTVKITLKNIISSDYGLLLVGILTTTMKEMKFKIVLVPEGPPQLCPGEQKLKTISATVGETKTVSICVMAYPGLDSVKLNGTRIYRNQTDSKFDVDYNIPTEPNRLYYTVNITVKAVTPTDYGLLRVDILTTEMEEMKYKLILKPEETPRITSFQITIINDHYNTLKKRIAYRTEILSKDFLVMKMNDLFLNFTCQATGIHLSDVKIVQSVTNKTLVSHSVPFTYQKPSGACGLIASFTCKVTNTFGDSGESKTIGILSECSSKIVEFQAHSPDVPHKSRYEQILTCKAIGYPLPDLLLSKLGVDGPLTSILGQNALEYTWLKIQCGDMGKYKCQSTNILNKEPVWQTFDLRVHGCSPQLCPWESASKTISSEIGDTKTVSICLVSSTVLYPHDTVAVNGTMFENRQDNGKFFVEYQADEENDMYYNVNLTVRNISMDDYGQLSIKIWSHHETETEWSRNSLEYNISLTYEGSPKLCPWESACKTISSETGDTKTVSICLVSSTVLYPHDTVAVNGIMFDNGQDNGKFFVEYQADEENDMYYTVNLTVRNISMDDYGQLSIKIWNHHETETEWSSNSLEYNISLTYEENPIPDEFEDDIGEEIPVGVTESPVDYVGENFDMWETLQTESKCQKLEELLTTAKKLFDSMLEIEFCNKPHSSRHDAYSDQTHQNEDFMDEIH